MVKRASFNSPVLFWREAKSTYADFDGSRVICEYAAEPIPRLVFSKVGEATTICVPLHNVAWMEFTA